MRGNVKEFSFNKLKIIDLQLFYYVSTLYVEIFSPTVFSKVVIKTFIFQRSIHFISYPIFNFYVFVLCFRILIFFNEIVMCYELCSNLEFSFFFSFFVFFFFFCSENFFYSYLILAKEIKKSARNIRSSCFMVIHNGNQS